ncbi:hypothetical protein JTT01_22105 [Clostridium botulinum]|nr:hypothetical protein [Clostridium botulinum]
MDLVRDNRDYWKWATESQGQERIASYPKEIVETFEKIILYGEENGTILIHCILNIDLKS